MTDANQLLMGSGSAAVKFDQIGASITGTVIAEPEARQQTDFRTKLPETWKDGSPKMQVVVRLSTTLRDPEKPDDDGERTLYIKGRELTNTIRAAVRASGANGIHTGGVLTVAYVADGPADPGMNPPKLYQAQYQPAAVSFNGVTAPVSPAPMHQQIPPTIAAPFTPPTAAAASQAPAGVDPAMWNALTDAQRQAVLAASGAQQPPF